MRQACGGWSSARGCTMSPREEGDTGAAGARNSVGSRNATPRTVSTGSTHATGPRGVSSHRPQVSGAAPAGSGKPVSSGTNVRGTAPPPPPPPPPPPRPSPKPGGCRDQQEQQQQQANHEKQRWQQPGFRFGQGGASKRDAPPPHTGTGPGGSVPRSSREAEITASLVDAKAQGPGSVRKTLKRLLLRWHPDKAPQGDTAEEAAVREEATQVLRFLLQERERLAI